jgi:hypothetical protein
MRRRKGNAEPENPRIQRLVRDFERLYPQPLLDTATACQALGGIGVTTLDELASAGEVDFVQRTATKGSKRYFTTASLLDYAIRSFRS